MSEASGRERPSGDSGREWRIARGDQVAGVVEVGGGLRSYEVAGRACVSGFAAGEACPASRGKLLLPWPNRIGDGVYTFAGVERRLAHTEPERRNAHAGLVAWLPFAPVAGEGSAESITLGADLFPQPGWDWHLRLRVTYALGDEGLAVTLAATNLSDEAAPFGCGAHPYLTAGEARVDDLVLRAPAARVLDVDDERLLPRTGPGGAPVVRQVDAATDLRGDAPLGERDLDLAYTDLAPDPDGRWRVTLTAGERRTTLWADAAAFPWLQIYTGGTLPEPDRRRTGVAVEPMTCAPDAFVNGLGLLRLAPGETWSGTFGITGE